MGFSTKVLLPLIVAATFVGAAFTINNAEAKSETDSAQSSHHSRNQEIHELSEKVSELNRNLAEADYRYSKKEEQIAELNRKISELKDSIFETKKTSFDGTSTVLNILIGFSVLVITGIGVIFGILAAYGVSSFREIKKEINDQLTLKSKELEAEINIRLSSKYKETVEEYFNVQGSKIREDFISGLNELEERLDECCGKANAAAPAKNVMPVVQQIQSGNAFDDGKS